MFISQTTGECGGIFYVLRNLVSRGWYGWFLNLKWKRITYCEYDETHGEWVYEPVCKAVINFIKEHKAARVALVLAAVGDALIWLSLLNVI